MRMELSINSSLESKTADSILAGIDESDFLVLYTRIPIQLNSSSQMFSIIYIKKSPLFLL